MIEDDDCKDRCCCDDTERKYRVVGSDQMTEVHEEIAQRDISFESTDC